MDSDPIWVEGQQTTVEALYDTQTIFNLLEADKVRFEFYVHDPKTRVARRVHGSLYAMVFDRITFE